MVIEKIELGEMTGGYHRCGTLFLFKQDFELAESWTNVHSCLDETMAPHFFGLDYNETRRVLGGQLRSQVSTLLGMAMCDYIQELGASPLCKFVA